MFKNSLFYKNLVEYIQLELSYWREQLKKHYEPAYNEAEEIEKENEKFTKGNLKKAVTPECYEKKESQFLVGYRSILILSRKSLEKEIQKLGEKNSD